MDSIGNDLHRGWPSDDISESANSNMLQSWAPTSSLIDLRPLGASTELSSWTQSYPRSAPPFTRPAHISTEDTLAQQQHIGIMVSDHELSPHPGNDTPQSTTADAAAPGDTRTQSDTDRPERKNTKRRRTGPDRFDNYLHGDTRLPTNTTTNDLFKKYPNHITDDDTEELWRLGFSARQISELMPNDTHFNSDGVHVQQHHSLIQKKFRIFKNKHEMRQQAMKDKATQPGHQDFLRLSTMQDYNQEAGHMILNARPNALPSKASIVIELPDLKFRLYPFDPRNDQAFEARMSIELAKAKPVPEHMAHGDYEICILNLLIRREIQRHVECLAGQSTQTRMLTDGTDFHPGRQLESHRRQQRFLAYVDCQRATHYNETSGALSRQWAIPRTDTATTGSASEALRALQFVIEQIYLRYSANATPPSAKRPLFNFEHIDLTRWRVLARLLYYLVSITRRLEADLNAEAASPQTHQVHRTFGEIRARVGSQRLGASDEELTPLIELPLVRELQSAAFADGSTTAADQQYRQAAFGHATSAARVIGPKYFAGTSLPMTHMMPSNFARVGIADRGAVFLSAHSVSANAAREKAMSGAYRKEFSTPARAGSSQEVAHEALPLTQSLQTSTPPADSIQLEMPAPAYDLLSEAHDYISFPSKSYERSLATEFISVSSSY